MACKEAHSPRTILVPANYEGTVRIVYAEKCGMTPMKENGREIVRIPGNGLVILSTENDVRINNDFFLVDDKGNQTKVDQVADIKDRVSGSPAILAGGTVVTGLSSHKDADGTVTATGIECTDFYLYNKGTTEIKQSPFQPQLDSLTNSEVNACRAGK